MLYPVFFIQLVRKLKLGQNLFYCLSYSMNKEKAVTTAKLLSLDAMVHVV